MEVLYSVKNFAIVFTSDVIFLRSPETKSGIWKLVCVNFLTIIAQKRKQADKRILCAAPNLY